MKYDFNGNSEHDSNFMRDNPPPETKIVADVQYIRLSSEEICHIQRVTTLTTGGSKLDHAHGAWANAETLNYVASDKAVEVQ